MINRLGNLEPFIPDRPARGERAEFSMASGEVGTGEHRGDQLTEALVALHPVEGCHGLPETVDRPTIVALTLVGEAEVYVRQQVQDDLPTGRSEREGVVGQAVDLVRALPSGRKALRPRSHLGHLVAGEGLEGLNNTGMQPPPP